MRIGERNRLKIRHIALQFSAQFTKCLDDRHHDGRGSKPNKPDPVGGELVKGFLNSLSKGHNLETVTIKIVSRVGGEESVEDTFGHLFDTAPLHRIKPSLMKIRGVRKLRYVLLSAPRDTTDPGRLLPMQVDNEHVGYMDHVGYMEVKTAMEHDWDRNRVKQESPMSWRKPFVPQVNRLLQWVEVEEERDRRLIRYREQKSPDMEET